MVSGDRYQSQFITLTIDICVQHVGARHCRTGLSAAVETCHC